MPGTNNEIQKYLRTREFGGKQSLGSNSRLHNELYSSTKCLRSWDPEKTKSGTHHGGIFNFDFSSDGSLLVAACERKSVLMFDPFNGNLIKVKADAHTDCVNCVRFLDTRCFATCSDDTTVCLWDARYLKNPYRTLRGHSNWVKNIEYDSNQGLLVTSGFDGSIYSWDINKYTETGVIYKRVFHTDGLMRSKLTPDASKLVIATARGYLIVVHNLDLHNLADDLHGFKPNLYRLMQTSEFPKSDGYTYDHMFSRQRNRVEIVSDFPIHDEADMIASLEIHPQGWCVVSRNRTGDETSEWTCVHDIQQYEDNDDVTDMEDEEKSKDHDNEDGSRGDHPANGAKWTSTPRTAEDRGASSSTEGPSSSRSEAPPTGQRHRSSFEFLIDDLEQDGERPQIVMTNDREGASRGNLDDDYNSNSDVRFYSNRSNRRQRRPRFEFHYSRRGNGGGLAPAENVDSVMAERSADSPNGGVGSSSSSSASEEQDESAQGDQVAPSGQAVVRIGDSVTLIIRARSQRAERTLYLLGQQTEEQQRQQQGESGKYENKIENNRPRLTHYIQEPNDGRGFIKEVCFSNDGRLVCSPFSCGIRLLAFDQECNELCDSVPRQPIQLHRVTSIMSHNKIVVTNKFSPVHKLIVSGSLNGQICFHQPVL